MPERVYEYHGGNHYFQDRFDTRRLADYTEVYGNCPRYIHKYQLVERSAYVPRSHQETPIPDWKRRDEMQVLLPADEPARKLFSGMPESRVPSR